MMIIFFFCFVSISRSWLDMVADNSTKHITTNHTISTHHRVELIWHLIVLNYSIEGRADETE